MKNSELLTILQGPIKWIKVFRWNDTPQNARQSIINTIIRQRDEFVKNFSITESAVMQAKGYIKHNLIYIKYLRRFLSDYKNGLIPVFNTWDEARDAYPDGFPEYPEYGRRAIWIREEESEDETIDYINDCKNEIRSQYKTILAYKGFISIAENYWEREPLNLPSFSLQTMDNHILIYHPEQECGEFIAYFKVPK